MQICRFKREVEFFPNHTLLAFFLILKFQFKNIKIKKNFKKFRKWLKPYWSRIPIQPKPCSPNLSRVLAVSVIFLKIKIKKISILP